MQLDGPGCVLLGDAGHPMTSTLAQVRNGFDELLSYWDQIQSVSAVQAVFSLFLPLCIILACNLACRDAILHLSPCACLCTPWTQCQGTWSAPQQRSQQHAYRTSKQCRQLSTCRWGRAWAMIRVFCFCATSRARVLRHCHFQIAWRSNVTISSRQTDRSAIAPTPSSLSEPCAAFGGLHHYVVITHLFSAVPVCPLQILSSNAPGASASRLERLKAKATMIGSALLTLGLHKLMPGSFPAPVYLLDGLRDARVPYKRVLEVRRKKCVPLQFVQKAQNAKEKRFERHVFARRCLFNM